MRPQKCSRGLRKVWRRGVLAPSVALVVTTDPAVTEDRERHRYLSGLVKGMSQEDRPRLRDENNVNLSRCLGHSLPWGPGHKHAVVLLQCWILTGDTTAERAILVEFKSGERICEGEAHQIQDAIHGIGLVEVREYWPGNLVRATEAVAVHTRPRPVPLFNYCEYTIASICRDQGF